MLQQLLGGKESAWQPGYLFCKGCCPLPLCTSFGRALYKLHACLHCQV